jgi:hypothetical protein
MEEPSRPAPSHISSPIISEVARQTRGRIAPVLSFLVWLLYNGPAVTVE